MSVKEIERQTYLLRVKLLEINDINHGGIEITDLEDRQRLLDDMRYILSVDEWIGFMGRSDEYELNKQKMFASYESVRSVYNRYGLTVPYWFIKKYKQT